MSGKQPREDGKESLKDKLKQILGINKPSVVQASSARSAQREFIFTQELLKEIGPESPANNRLRTITELCSVVERKQLEPNAVEALWQNIVDLLQPQVSRESRHVALNFLQCLIKGQYGRLGILRAHFFRVIKNHTLLEDLPERLDVFVTLTDSGKDLEYFEEDTGPFLLSWMQDIITSSRVGCFLTLLINIIKFNAAHLDQDVVTGLVSNTCLNAMRTNSEENIELCMKVLDTIICYSFLPPEALYHFIVCLCFTVNVEKFCQSSWGLMRKLLGTHLGHSAIYTMCCILQNRNNAVESSVRLLRGAVFFIGMALWGSQKVASLKFPPTTVLPSFIQALRNTEEPIVPYEVVLSVQRLISKYGKEQQSVTWDLLLDIIEKLFEYVENSGGTHPTLEGKVHDILTSLEQLHEQGNYHGDTERIFKLIEKCASKRPETSLLVLVAYKAESVQPGHDGWIHNLYHLLDKYFRQDSRQKVRVKVLSVLSKILNMHKNLYEDELIETVVLPHLSHIHLDHDVQVRKVAAELLIDLIKTCQTSWCFDLLDVIKKIVSHPVIIPSPPPGEHNKPVADISCLDDVVAAVFGLIKVFKVKLYQLPPSYALQSFELLYSHLHLHYKYEHLLPKGTSIRLAILECFLSLRADSMHRLGLLKENESQPIFSPYALSSYRGETTETHTVPSSPMSVAASPTPPLHNRTTVIPYTEAFRCICQCLEIEKDWHVLSMVLEQLPRLLQNKNLILSSLPEDVERFCGRLCSMLSDRNLGLPERLVGIPDRFSKSDFHAFVFPVLTCLVSYHRYLDKARQRDLVNCLEFGLVSKCARSVIAALQVSALEMSDVMMRQLPHLLLRLSQISATVAMAVPVLEYLSSLIRIPNLYANFVEEQYKSIFAIALPYTNPFKYSHYAVSLAYHVIAMWFLRCRLSFRKAFVGFIVKGLKANVLRQFEESAAARAVVNQDSSGRGRTSSLGEDMKKKRPRIRPQSMADPEGTSKPVHDDVMSLFHRELMETCLDMMARYTYSNIVAMPKRSPLAEFLLADGQTSSWLLGNKVITITTSSNSGASIGSLIKPLASDTSVLESSSSPQQSASTPGRRRHKSAAVGSSLTQITPLFPRPVSKDDMLLHRQSSDEDKLHQSETAEITLERLTHSDSVLKRNASLDIPEDQMQNAMPGGKPSIKSMYDYLRSSWVEVHVRRPTGNIAWMMRIENQHDIVAGPSSNLLTDLSHLVLPSKHPEDTVSPTTTRINSDNLEEGEYDTLHQQHFDDSSSSQEGQHKQGQVSQDTLKLPEKQTSNPTVGSSQDSEKSKPDSATKPSLKKCSSTPDLTDCLHQKLKGGDLHGELQQAFDRASNLKPDEIKVSSTTSTSSADQQVTAEVTKPDRPPDQPTSPPPSSTQPEVAPSNDPSSKGQKFRPRGNAENQDQQDTGYTVSGMRPILKYRRHKTDTSIALDLNRIPESGREYVEVNPSHGQGMAGGMDSLNAGVINPSFVFLQLYHGTNLWHGQDHPTILPPENMAVNRAVKNLDRIYPYETQKIGVVYVGPGQATNQTSILSNVYGSTRYADFLHGIGRLLRLSECDLETTYTGGLEQNGSDGLYAYSWHDDILQVIFHVATLMPNRESDPQCNAKKLHIGNDYVTVVYNDSGEEYRMGTIKGQFNYVNIIIQALDHESNAITVQAKPDIAEVIGHQDTKIISDTNLSSLVRQMALHANLASLILQRQQTNPADPYASNWLERLRQIKRIRSKINQEATSGNKSPISNSSAEDFTKYS